MINNYLIAPQKIPKRYKNIFLYIVFIYKMHIKILQGYHNGYSGEDNSFSLLVQSELPLD